MPRAAVQVNAAPGTLLADERETLDRLLIELAIIAHEFRRKHGVTGRWPVHTEQDRRNRERYLEFRALRARVARIVKRLR